MIVVDLPPVSRGLPTAIGRRFRGDYRVDEWGLDDDLVGLLAPLARLRWSIDAQGVPHLPLDGPAMLVYSRRVGWSEQAVLGSAVYRATRRVVRFPGVPDRSPVGPLLRRIGGVLRRPDELAGLLRAGRLVSVALSRELLSQHAAGSARPDLLGAALTTGAPVIPVAVIGFEPGRRWRVAFGPPLSTSASHAPLAATELAERARDAVQDLLDEHVPSRWGLY